MPKIIHPPVPYKIKEAIIQAARKGDKTCAELGEPYKLTEGQVSHILQQNASELKIARLKKSA